MLNLESAAARAVLVRRPAGTPFWTDVTASAEEERE
jgi:hypothetical protein